MRSQAELRRFFSVFVVFILRALCNMFSWIDNQSRHCFYIIVLQYAVGYFSNYCSGAFIIKRKRVDSKRIILGNGFGIISNRIIVIFGYRYPNRCAHNHFVRYVFAHKLFIRKPFVTNIQLKTIRRLCASKIVFFVTLAVTDTSPQSPCGTATAVTSNKAAKAAFQSS